jgi:hypothetical protein
VAGSCKYGDEHVGSGATERASYCFFIMFNNAICYLELLSVL